MDLGTNMFHLLIVEGGRTIVHEQDAVKLGEGGINKGFIIPAAFERGIQTMQRFNQLIIRNKVSKVRAIATSALRNATNGEDFIKDVKFKTGIAIEIIDGDQEAAFIYKGIKAAGCLSASKQHPRRHRRRQRGDSLSATTRKSFGSKVSRSARQG